MLSFLKKALFNQQTPEAMKAAASFVQQELRANKVAYSLHSKDFELVDFTISFPTNSKLHESMN